MSKQVVWFGSWERANLYQDSLTLRNESGIAYAVEMPDGRFGVTDDEDEVRQLRERGVAVNVIDRRSSRLQVKRD